MKARLFVLSIVAAGVCSVPFLSASTNDDEKTEAEDKIVYQGTWVNRKMRSSGPLKCTMTIGEGEERSAVFEGKFKNDPFKYDVKFAAKKGKARTELKGDAIVDGDPTEWIGAIRGDRLTIRYLSRKGYNGEFTMKKKAPPKKKEKPKK